MSRGEVAQKAPAHGLDLVGFPRVELAGTSTSAYRAHGAALGPWFYASGSDGRFNLHAPSGTCYAADTVGVALRERFGDVLVGRNAVTDVAAHQTRVSEIRLPQDCAFACVVDSGAVTYGITRELSTMTDYDVTRAWAEVFAGAGFLGVRYPARYSTGFGADAWAIFGNAGPDAAGVVFKDGGLDGVAACEAAGIMVLSTAPKRRDMTIIAPPPRDASD